MQREHEHVVASIVAAENMEVIIVLSEPNKKIVNNLGWVKDLETEVALFFKNINIWNETA